MIVTPQAGVPLLSKFRHGEEGGKVGGCVGGEGGRERSTADFF